MNKILFLLALLVLFSHCSKDEDDTMEENMPNEEIIEPQEPETIFTLTSDQRDDSSFDTYLIWLTDNDGKLIDSSHHDLQINESVEIKRPESYTGTEANVNILKLGQSNSFESFSNITLPSSYKALQSEIDNAYPYGNGDNLNQISLIISIPEDEVSSFPENVYGRSLTAPNLEDITVADSGRPREDFFTKQFELELSLWVNDIDSIVLYNPVTEGNYNREKIYSQVVQYDKSVNGDTLRFEHTILELDQNAEIIDLVSNTFADGIYPFVSRAKNGSVFNNEVAEFILPTSVFGLAIPSVLKGMNYVTNARTKLVDSKYRSLKSCTTNDAMLLPLTDEDILKNNVEGNFASIYDFTISNASFDYDAFRVFQLYTIDDLSISLNIYMDSYEENFIFPSIPEDFIDKIPFTWDEEIFTMTSRPYVVFFYGFTQIDGLDEYYNFLTQGSLEAYENYFMNNCTTEFRVVL